MKRILTFTAMLMAFGTMAFSGSENSDQMLITVSGSVVWHANAWGD